MMTDIMKKVVVLLEEAESFIVPIRWVWKKIEEETPSVDISVEQLAEKLKKDRRFKLFDEYKIDYVGQWSLSEEEQERLGYYRGPRVMLRDRVPTREEVIQFLVKKVDQTFDTLKQAWDIRPKDDESTEDQLLEALAKAQKLQRDLRGILSEEKEENITNLSSGERC
jgi:flagellin-specific chaperone FliS